MPGLLEELGAGFALVGDTGRVISACPVYADMVGLAQSDVIGLTLEDCTHPDDLPAVRWLIRQAGAHGQVANIRKRYLRPDGTVLWVEQRLVLLQGASRKTLMVAVRPVKCSDDAADAAAVQPGLVEYVADMSRQLSDMAKLAMLPTTCDLLNVASRTAVDEGGDDGMARQAP